MTDQTDTTARARSLLLQAGRLLTLAEVDPEVLPADHLLQAACRQAVSDLRAPVAWTRAGRCRAHDLAAEIEALIPDLPSTGRDCLADLGALASAGHLSARRSA